MTYCVPVYLRRVFLSRLSRFFFLFFFFSGFARSSGSLIKISCKSSVVQVGGDTEFSRAIERIHL